MKLHAQIYLTTTTQELVLAPFISLSDLSAKTCQWSWIIKQGVKMDQQLIESQLF